MADATPDWVRAAVARWKVTHREKFLAHKAIYTAVKFGRMTRGPCEVCGTTKSVEAHHDDYSKRFDVRWLCRTHHREHHRNEKVVSNG